MCGCDEKAMCPTHREIDEFYGPLIEKYEADQQEAYYEQLREEQS
jgi:hypothetical protein